MWLLLGGLPDLWPLERPQQYGFPLTPFSLLRLVPPGEIAGPLGPLLGNYDSYLFLPGYSIYSLGYEFGYGRKPFAARYAGMNVTTNIMLVMLISGGIAGIAGMIEVSGITHRLQQGISPGYGYTAIIVAWLARLNTLAIIMVAFLFGALLVGGFAVQLVGVSFSITQVLQGTVLFFLLAGEIFINYKIVLSHKEVL